MIGNIRKNPNKRDFTGAIKTLNEFFGTEEWKSRIMPSENLEKAIHDYYLERLRSIKQKALIETISIELMRENLHYYLIYVTRETKRKSPYLSTVRWLKKFVEKVDKRELVDRAIKSVLGIEKTRSITEYLKPKKS